MKSFWKKKLPSLLLALLMMISLVPAAAAAGADVTYTVAPGSKVTFDIADFSALKSYDYLVFTEYKTITKGVKRKELCRNNGDTVRVNAF